VCPEGQPPPVAVVHCNDLRSEHRSSVIAVRPPSRDQSPCPAMRTCRHHWRMLRHSTAEETSNPGGRRSLQVPRGHLLGCAVDSPRERPIPQDGQPNIRRQVWLLHHSWRRALTQCRARYHISIHPLGWPDPLQVRSFRRGVWSLPPFERQTHAGLYPELPCGERTLLLAAVWLCGLKLAERSGVDTLRIDLAARVLFRGVERLISPTHRTFGPRLATASMVSR